MRTSRLSLGWRPSVGKALLETRQTPRPKLVLAPLRGASPSGSTTAPFAAQALSPKGKGRPFGLEAGGLPVPSVRLRGKQAAGPKALRKAEPLEGLGLKPSHKRNTWLRLEPKSGKTAGQAERPRIRPNRKACFPRQTQCLLGLARPLALDLPTKGGVADWSQFS